MTVTESLYLNKGDILDVANKYSPFEGSLSSYRAFKVLGNNPSVSAIMIEVLEVSDNHVLFSLPVGSTGSISRDAGTLEKLTLRSLEQRALEV